MLAAETYPNFTVKINLNWM